MKNYVINIKDNRILGEPLNFRGMVYAPVNEQGVIFLFGMVCEDLNFKLEEIRTNFPDCAVIYNDGKKWKPSIIEFEYKSSNFIDHKHNPDKCDYIICWEHDWKDYPKEKLTVISLKNVVIRLKKLDEKRIGFEISRENNVLEEQDHKIKDILSRKNSPNEFREFFYKLSSKIKEIDEGIWLKVTKNRINYYVNCFIKNVFAYIYPQAKALKIRYLTSEDWVSHHINNEEEIITIMPLIKKSLDIVRSKFFNQFFE